MKRPRHGNSSLLRGIRELSARNNEAFGGKDRFTMAGKSALHTAATISRRGERRAF
jgi:hypothetical protein